MKPSPWTLIFSPRCDTRTAANATSFYSLSQTTSQLNDVWPGYGEKMQSSLIEFTLSLTCGVLSAEANGLSAKGAPQHLASFLAIIGPL